MLAVPDFEAGAMENWGLVTYRETALLYNQLTSWQANKDRVAVVVAHELAHQWFGNLVTMQSWNDLWLNEGFATYFEVMGADYILGNTTRMQDRFNVDQLQPALLLDQLNNTRPILADVVSPSEIESIFDAITYNKGGSVIRMLAYTLDMDGKPVFQKGLQSWITKAGYPVITVSRDYSSSVAVLSQSRFYLCSEDSKNSSDAWYVPIWYKQRNDQENRFVWLNANKKATVTGLSNDDWLLVNVRQKSFCRVNYDLRNWKLIQQQLLDDYEKIHFLSRAQLLDDSQNLARAGLISYELALNLTKYLSKETSYVPWTALLPTFYHLHTMMAEKPEFVYYKKYMHILLRPQMQRLNDRVDEFLKNVVVHQACALGESTCVRMVLNMFDKFKDDCGNSTTGTASCSRIPPYYRREVYCTAMAHGSSEDWLLLWNLYKSEEQPVESMNLLHGLCCTRKPDLISTLLSQAVKADPTVRKQDIPFIFQSLKTNTAAKWLIWTFLVNNVDRILKK
ncbi:unnamed protein product [Soboliphyme baturini]|uniref:Aminopeptidase N n=1 Tax=Soboliphyme baturini TaxID=241478 RepID=A0A183J2S9_9BILA|nr:unnamed protein product [Soboliphyme baturini]